MTSKRAVASIFGIFIPVLLVGLFISIVLPQTAHAAEVAAIEAPAMDSAPTMVAETPTQVPTITNAQELVDFLNTDTPEVQPNAQLTDENTVTLLASTTVASAEGLVISPIEGATITLNLAGQTLSFANAADETSPYLLAMNGEGTFAVTGEGTMAFAMPEGDAVDAIGVLGGTLDVSAEIAVTWAETDEASGDGIVIYGGAVALHEGGTLRQVITETGESYHSNYQFITMGGSHAETTSTLTMDGGLIEIADDRFGIVAYGDSNIAISGGTISQMTSAEGENGYIGALYTMADSASVTLSGGTIGLNTFAIASSGSSVTMTDGVVHGGLCADGEGSTITVTGGVLDGFQMEGFANSIQLTYGASASISGGAFGAGIYSGDEGTRATISGGSFEGWLEEDVGGAIRVVPPAEGAEPAAFYYPVVPSILDGLGASLLRYPDTDLNEGAMPYLQYYPTLVEAQMAAQVSYASDEFQTCTCGTVAPDANVVFATFGDDYNANNDIRYFNEWLGAEFPELTSNNALYGLVSVTPDQTYLCTFTDEAGNTIGEQTLTAGSDDWWLLTSIAVDVPAEDETNATAGGDAVPEINQGTYTLSVAPVNEGDSAADAASECLFGVSTIIAGFNGGAYHDQDHDYLLDGTWHWYLWNNSDLSYPGYRLTGWTCEPADVLATSSQGEPYLLIPLFEGTTIKVTAQWEPDVVEVSRLWNPYNGAHLLTTDAGEAAALSDAGWRDEETVFSEYGSAFPGSTPVTRVYNPFNGDHLYSTSEAEVADLVGYGWQDEGVKFYGSPETTIPVYRLWNSLQTADGGLGSHLWTADQNEYDTLPQLPPVGAWQKEGAVWYAVSVPAK